MTPVSIDALSEYKQIKVSGNKTPNFRYLVENNDFVPPLNYSLEIDMGDKKLVSIYGADQFKRPNENYSFYCTWGRLAIKNWYNPLREEAVLDAMISFDNNMLLKLKGQSLPILMALKERKQTATLIENFLEKTIKAAAYVRHPKRFFKIMRGRSPSSSETRRLKNAYRRLLSKERAYRRRKAFSRAVTVSDAYLEYRFAWKPLLSDISDMLDGAANVMKKSTAKMARKAITKDFTFVRDLPTFFSPGTPGGQLQAVVSIRGHQKIFYCIDDASLALYSQSQSFMATGWDSVPYSFIVDGLVNVSKFLECSNATLGIRFLSGYKSVVVQAASSLKPIPYFRNGSWKLRYDQLPSYRTQLTFNRQILTDFPVPKLEFPYEDYLTTQHVVDLGALAIQKLKRAF